MDSTEQGARPPEPLACLSNWLVWKRKPVEGKKDKKEPYYANGTIRHGEQGTAADRAALKTYDVAANACLRLGFDGIGFAFLPDCGVVGLDFDDCVTDGVIDPRVQELVKNCAYVELSPSGTGLHAFYRGYLPNGSSHPIDSFGLDVFSTHSYMTVTGRTLFDCDLFAAELGPVPDAVIALHVERFGDVVNSGGNDLLHVDRPAVLARGLDPEVQTEIRGALQHLAEHDHGRTYDEWQAVGHALKSLPADVGLQLWLDFSALVSDGTEADDREARAKWRQLRGDRTDFRAIFKRAQDLGWINPRKTTGRETFGDISNGARFATKYRGRFLYVHDLKRWLQWDGVRWIPVDDGVMLAGAKVIANDIVSAAAAALQADDSEANKRNLTAAINVHRKVDRLRGLLTMASSELGLSIPTAALLDADPMLLGVRNGVVDLRTGTLLAPSPQMLITKHAGAGFDRSARCPRFLAFMSDIHRGDVQVIAFMQRAVGYSLTGLVDEEVLFFLFGRGANGKSVFANILCGVLGDYVVTVRSELLVARKIGNESAREVVRLRGARVALINETGRDDLMDDQRVKELVSRERISGRALYSDGIDFMPTHKLWMRGNHQPGVRDGSDGFWRRMHLIGFHRQFGCDEQVPDLDRQILDAERDGILAWAIDGCLAWQREGLKPPQSIQLSPTAV